MFFLGFFAGIAAASWFILADNGERLIRLGARMRDAARTWREWQSSDRFFP